MENTDTKHDAIDRRLFEMISNSNTKPDYDTLLHSIIDVIQEQQIKIGYRKEKIQLYYPLSSVNNLLDTNVSSEEMMKLLKNFISIAEPVLGNVSYTAKQDRFCFYISEDGVTYAHKTLDTKSFLKDFIEKISRHKITIEEICSVFQKYSENYHCEKISSGEFDFLLWFEEGVPDTYLYCIKFEECHAIYHRFTKKDYKEFLEDDSKL